MASSTHTFKKTVMMYFWRIQQAQMVIGVFFWSMTLTGIFYEYFRAKFNNFGFAQDQVFYGMTVMFLMVLGIIVMFGIIYDRLKFWKEQQFVVIERNPYTSWKLNPVFTQWIELWVEMAKSIENPTPELQNRIKFMQEWVRRCEEIDPWTKEMRSLTRKFALEGDDAVMKVFLTNAE